MFYRENEVCLCRESGSYKVVEKTNDYPKTSLGCSLSRAGWHGHAERNRVGALADNVGRHEVVSGLASQARRLSNISPFEIFYGRRNNNYNHQHKTQIYCIHRAAENVLSAAGHQLTVLKVIDSPIPSAIALFLQRALLASETSKRNNDATLVNCCVNIRNKHTLARHICRCPNIIPSRC